MLYDQDAKPLNWQSYTTNIKIKPGQWAKALTEGVSFRFQIDAPAGDVYLRTGVYDAVQSRVGTLEIPLSAVKLSRKGD